MAKHSTGAAVAALVCFALLSGCQRDDPTANQSLQDPATTESLRDPAATEPVTDPTTTQPVPNPTVPDRWTIGDPRVDESSGLARSDVHPGVFYTHNDKNGPLEVFAVSPTGTLAVLHSDVLGVDWEDIATSNGHIWVADTGDNDLVRTTINVVRLEEPQVLVSADLPSTSYTFVYPDGAHDAEALLVDPRNDRVFVVTKTKSKSGGRIYRAPSTLSSDEPNTLQRVAKAPPGISGGDYAPEGGRAVLRNQGHAYFYQGFQRPPVHLDLPRQQQGEAVTFTPDGDSVLVGTEGTNSSVIRVPVPQAGE